MYGSGIRGVRKALLAQANLAVSAEDARLMLEAWRETYPAVPAAIKLLSDAALSVRPISDICGEMHQYLTLPLEGLDLTKKYTYYPTFAKDKDGGTYNPKEAEAHNAFNGLTQGTAGLITLDAITRVSKQLGDLIDIHATVHDSFEYSCPETKLDEVLQVSERIMTDYPIRPALKVEFEIARPGKSWADKEVYHVHKD
jgi:hypothetical protein